jgi:hypothetical protein
LGLRLLGVLTVVLVVACSIVVGLSRAAPFALPRATEDRSDEIAGEQVHLLYVIPTDAPDEQLDVNGALTSSIARTQAWFSGQTGGPKLRLDTYQGQPDITFVRTSLAPAITESFTVREYVEQLGFTNARKLYLVYVGTYPESRCGVSALGLKAAIVYLSCTSQYPQGSTFGVVDSVAMHEVLHALGAVPDEAPHVTYSNHVEDPSDIMYRTFNVDLNGEVTLALDPGRDDYYGHGKQFADVAQSRYLDSNPPPPPSAQKLSMGSVRRIKAPRGRLTVSARVKNAGAGGVSVRCSAKQGKRRLRVLAAQYASGSAVCRFKGVRRGVVSGKITASSSAGVASRAFRLRP